MRLISVLGTAERSKNQILENEESVHYVDRSENASTITPARPV